MKRLKSSVTKRKNRRCDLPAAMISRMAIKPKQEQLREPMIISPLIA